MKSTPVLGVLAVCCVVRDACTAVSGSEGREAVSRMPCL